MKKLLLTFIAIFFTGCASFNYRVVGWYNDDASILNKIVLSNGKVATVVGNPHITCYTKRGFKLGDGYFVTVEDGMLEIDEFGKRYVWVPNSKENYCILGEDQK